MTNDNKAYKVLEGFELDGVLQELDSVVNLTEDQAAEFAGKVELVDDNARGASDPSESAPASDDVPPADPTPETPADTPAPSAPAAEDKPGWVGGHKV